MTAKIIYWSLVIGLAIVFLLGIWIAFFYDAILTKRGKLAEARLGKRGVVFFQSTIRVLALVASILAFYLLFRILSIVQCAI